MKIADILSDKGSNVTTARSDATMTAAIAVLAEQRIGALPISDDGKHLDGILSERDVVRALADDKGSLFDSLKVSDLMTQSVRTCTPESTLAEVMNLMNEHRIRHVPVVTDGDLVGMLSIRDLVHARLREAEVEQQQMAAYIADRTY